MAAFTIASLASFAMASAPLTTPNDSTFGMCAEPLNAAAAQSGAAVAAFMQKQGCKTIIGGDNVPVGTITGHRCRGPGPEIVTAAVDGYSIDSVFNPAPCPPGTKCL
ncbi:hypothetical protein G7Y89_g2006 [Cudoniella acicularis]|uniref:Uncharacterized protein n=1 Tax=Cudoniella acicularis TaxID=354080 RepID=A0A8H4RU46_9HELO|nr:hypothetical protein G7Y89_g2006 [Cudoniella acicularis]